MIYIDLLGLAVPVIVKIEKDMAEDCKGMDWDEHVREGKIFKWQWHIHQLKKLSAHHFK